MIPTLYENPTINRFIEKFMANEAIVQSFISSDPQVRLRPLKNSENVTLAKRVTVLSLDTSKGEFRTIVQYLLQGSRYTCPSSIAITLESPVVLADGKEITYNDRSAFADYVLNNTSLHLAFTNGTKPYEFVYGFCNASKEIKDMVEAMLREPAIDIYTRKDYQAEDYHDDIQTQRYDFAMHVIGMLYAVALQQRILADFREQVKPYGDQIEIKTIRDPSQKGKVEFFVSGPGLERTLCFSPSLDVGSLKHETLENFTMSIAKGLMRDTLPATMIFHPEFYV